MMVCMMFTAPQEALSDDQWLSVWSGIHGDDNGKRDAGGWHFISIVDSPWAEDYGGSLCRPEGRCMSAIPAP